MAFFDKVGNTISTKSKELSQKARSFSETNSLNSIIRNEQRKIDASYKMIGKLWFEKYGENPPEEFHESVNTITESQKKIDDAQAQIKKINNRYKCPNCGASFKYDSVFCSKCGTKIKTESQEQKTVAVCSGCGNVMEDSAIFCDKCGKKAGDDTLAVIEEKEVVSEILPENSPKKCSECGMESDDENALFCNNCGNKFT